MTRRRPTRRPPRSKGWCVNYNLLPPIWCGTEAQWPFLTCRMRIRRCGSVRVSERPRAGDGGVAVGSLCLSVDRAGGRCGHRERRVFSVASARGNERVQAVGAWVGARQSLLFNAKWSLTSPVSRSPPLTPLAWIYSDSSPTRPHHTSYAAATSAPSAGPSHTGIRGTTSNRLPL